jgi:hypothetical protein
MKTAIRYIEFNPQTLRCSHARYAYSLDLGVGHSYRNDVTGIELDNADAQVPLAREHHTWVKQVFSYQAEDVMTQSKGSVLVSECEQINTIFMDNALRKEFPYLFRDIENEAWVSGLRDTNRKLPKADASLHLFKMSPADRTLFLTRDIVYHQPGGAPFKQAKRLLSALTEGFPIKPSDLFLSGLIEQAKNQAIETGRSFSISYTTCDSRCFHKIDDKCGHFIALRPCKGKVILSVSAQGAIKLAKDTPAQEGPQP